MRVVSEEEVRSVFELGEALDLVRRVYRMADLGRADVSHPAALGLRGGAGTATRFKIKGAVLDDLDVAGFRLIGDADRQHGSDVAYCYLVDPRTAAPFALVDEVWLHGVRTALTGLVTVAALAPDGAENLTLVGTGRIAQAFATYLDAVMPGISLTLVSRSPDRAAGAAAAWSELMRRPVHSAPSVAEAVRTADIVVTVSDANEDLFQAADLRAGTLVCAMGGRREFPRDVLDRADRFIVDEMDFVCTAGNVSDWIRTGSIARTEVEAALDETIGSVLRRTDRDPVPPGKIWLAVIQGMAACDIGLAKWCFDRLNGIGGQDARG